MEPRTRRRAFWTSLTLTLCVTSMTLVASGITDPVPQAAQAESVPARSLSWNIALAPHAGSRKLDDRIRKAQDEVRRLSDPRYALERLGWLFVAKAREQQDPGFYLLAQHCSKAIQEDHPDSLEALLLRGHVAQSLHRFVEAEAIGRQLISRREFAADFGLLGDALADQGRLTEAIPHYQRMVDLRPDLQSYSRVAHVRWLKGDLEGAIEAARDAASSAGSSDSEAAAWALSRLAHYEFVGGAGGEVAALSCTRALEYAPTHAPALLVRARLHLAEGRPEASAELLRRAVISSPLPEIQWALADSLRASGNLRDAAKVEAELNRSGVANDPRGLALFLATHGKAPDRALRLAREELKTRADVFSHDALAWALVNAGRPDDAWPSMERALAEGTRDARLFLHASVIAAELNRSDAGERLELAKRHRHLLLPSEQRRLDQAIETHAAARHRAPVSNERREHDSLSATGSRMPNPASDNSVRLPFTPAASTQIP